MPSDCITCSWWFITTCQTLETLDGPVLSFDHMDEEMRLPNLCHLSTHSRMLLPDNFDIHTFFPALRHLCLIPDSPRIPLWHVRPNHNYSASHLTSLKVSSYAFTDEDWYADDNGDGGDVSDGIVLPWGDRLQVASLQVLYLEFDMEVHLTMDPCGWVSSYHTIVLIAH